MKTNIETPILNITQVSKLFGVEETTVRNWARNKMIPGYKIGKSWFFNRARVLEKQSLDDTAKHYDNQIIISHSKLFDILSKDGEIEVKSSRAIFDKSGRQKWYFTGLHNPDDSNYHLFLGYNLDRSVLEVIYKISTNELQKMIKPKEKSDNFKNRKFTIYKDDVLIKKYIIYSI